MLRALSLAVLLTAAPAAAQTQSYGPRLEGFEYAFPVQQFALTSQGQDLEMAFIDVAPSRPNGRTVVLLHGKNFCAGTWEATIRKLSDAGYRVIAPDQIGFCKSSKPSAYQFSFHQLATNTRALLRARGVEKAVIVGHSMGGMLAARYALTYPTEVEQLVMVNPLGLEDWKAKGVPYATVDENLQTELKTTFQSIKAYQLKFYYPGGWRPEYDKWVGMQAGLYAGPGKRAVAWNQALTSDMIFTQPVVYEFARISVPTLLLIGQTDRTAPGGTRATPEVQKTLGDYPALGRAAARGIPSARLVEFARLGHAPQIEAPDEFHAALLQGLARE
ncbi:alpha/beta fold hydrolase [Phenylobacterium deserti]|uniref:Alpha/beta hydrolase n=1 Tax=Phenylobacterium deserti TaxID=1914756 RepID=A0A328AR70_9CAUL|nr:alpha/beta hydrolase [Phenylobacterium deserti]RAK56785.1 alpha/beta hydrolase [Phenylobacterium deserti]